jgi:hypothetical protein
VSSVDSRVNVVNFYHGGDLGDTVYAIPALRRLARPAHLTLYPNHRVTRALMDEDNANMLLPLLNVQHNITADWKPTHGSEGLRLDFAVRRFYKNGYNIADIHSHWIGHDHWNTEHPWLIADHAAESPYRIVVARSARYRNDKFPWKALVDQFEGRACFVGVPWEHEDFEKHYGAIDYIITPSLLEVARLMAAADIAICNQSCPRAVAEALKIPVIVEVGNPNNTHFGRESAWYPELEGAVPSLSDENLERIWCECAARRSLGLSEYSTGHLAELARLCRGVRRVRGDALEIGASVGGSAAVIAWALNRAIHLVHDFCQRNLLDARDPIDAFLSVYRYHLHEGDFPSTLPEGKEFAFVHIDTQGKEGLKRIIISVMAKMPSGGVIAISGMSSLVVREATAEFGGSLIDIPTKFHAICAFQIK